MEIFLSFIVFCIVLFFYIHIHYHLKTSNDLEIFDTWFVSGLAGTGSKDVACYDLFVPDYMVFDPFLAREGFTPGTENLEGDDEYKTIIEQLNKNDNLEHNYSIGGNLFESFSDKLIKLDKFKKNKDNYNDKIYEKNYNDYWNAIIGLSKFRDS